MAKAILNAIKSPPTGKNEILVSKGDLRIGARRNSRHLLESGVHAGTGRRNGTSRVECRRLFLVHPLERRRHSRPSSCPRLGVCQTEVSSTTHRSRLRGGRVCSRQRLSVSACRSTLHGVAISSAHERGCPP